MSAKRLLLTIPAGLLWGVGAFLMQSAVDEHMAWALAAVISFVICLVVLFAPLSMVMGLSMVFSWFYVAAALVLALIEWDWQAMAAAFAYGAAGVLSLVVVLYVDHLGSTSSGEPTASDGGRRRLVPAFRRHRRSVADEDGDGI